MTAESPGRLPDFFVIGAAKSGTTTLHQHLAARGDVFVTRPKEPDFFSSSETVDETMDWYRSLFADAGPDQLVGEMSTTYSRWPHTDDAAALVHEHCPDARLVYVMRHPVDRAYSHYAHHMRLGVTASFEESLAADDIYVDCSRYEMQIQRWERFFDPSALLLVRFRSLVDDTEATLDRVAAHLGLPTAPPAAPDAAANVRGEHFLRDQLTQRADRIPGARQLVRAIPKPLRDRLFRAVRDSSAGRVIRAEVDPEPMLPTTRAALLDELAPDVAAIERRTGWVLDDWRR